DGAESYYRKNGTIELFLLQAHAGADPGKDRRLEEEPVVESLVLRPPPATHEIGALLLADVDVSLDLLQGRLIDERPDVRTLLAPVAEPERTRPVDEPAHEIVVH